MDTLEDLRKSIDNIDNAIIAMFAERFKVTAKVGVYKATNGLPAKDIEREKIQFQRISEYLCFMDLIQILQKNCLGMSLIKWLMSTKK